jgi:hypothetical protein
MVDVSRKGIVALLGASIARQTAVQQAAKDAAAGIAAAKAPPAPAAKP